MSKTYYSKMQMHFYLILFLKMFSARVEKFSFESVAD